MKKIIDLKVVRYVCFLFAIYLFIVTVFNEYMNGWLFSDFNRYLNYAIAFVCVKHFWSQWAKHKKVYDDIQKNGFW